jgi:hypothetical protein
MQRITSGSLAAAVAVMFGLALPALASAAPSGAIFTTLADGSEVNFNQFPTKEAVYLDGGPGPGAPQTAAGLDDGRYVFQVTNPSGKELLSTDPAECRQFDVVDGVISNVVVTGCEHVTGFDIDHGATTVQLFPYDDTPNNGGVYKVWITPLADFLAGCAELGVANGLAVVDCGNAPGNRHGFVPADSKTDNFKVKSGPIIEIDTNFIEHEHTGAARTLIDGLMVTWTDPLGASNVKWSYHAPWLLVEHQAHVEAIETGTHKITIADQPGCKVAHVVYNGVSVDGPTTITTTIRNDRKDLNVFIDVYCDQL